MLAWWFGGVIQCKREMMQMSTKQTEIGARNNVE
jgi:hypothetical protein